MTSATHRLGSHGSGRQVVDRSAGTGGGATTRPARPSERDVPRAPARRAAVELQLLHRFAVQCDGVEVDLPASAQRLVAYLALRGAPVNRLLVGGALWTTSSEERAAASLRTALWRAGACGCPLVASRGSTLAIDGDVQVDVSAVELRARGLLREGPGAASTQPSGALLDAGEILPDWFDDWVLLARERFRQLRLQSLEVLAEQLLAAGRHGAAIEAATVAMECEPLRESAHRLLIEIHLAQGNHVEARRQFELCRQLLARQVGVPPSAALQALARDHALAAV